MAFSLKILETLADEVDKAAKKTDPHHTEKEKKDGDYKMGSVKVHGLKIFIENAKGSERSGKDKDGKPWSVTMPAHYGFFDGFVGKDKDEIDVYIGKSPESEDVWVVNQVKENGGFDEHKVFVGFSSEADVISTYDAAFSGDLGPKLRDSVVSTTIDELKEWLKTGNKKEMFSKRDLVAEFLKL